MKVQRNIRSKPSRGRGFTRIDLVVLIFTICLGVAIANPLFMTHSRIRADTLVCQANLAEIGRGYHIWGMDHDNFPPFLVLQADGGLRQHPMAPNAYVHFAWLSNGLSSPKVLVCPADPDTTRRAKDFSGNPDGGLIHPAYRNNAVSYMVSFHAQRYRPRSILSGDRNIEPLQPGACAYTAFPCQTVTAQSSRWGQNIHWTRGNLLFSDGSVEESDTTQLRAMVVGDDNDDVAGLIHVLLPK